MNQREAMELIKQAKSLPALIASLRQAGAESALYDWSMRYFIDVRARNRGIPLKGTFEITPLCNLDCKMCYVHLNAAQLKGQKPLPAEDWEKIMGEAIDNGMMYASFTGGECLTSPDFDRLYLFLHKHGVQVSILTNAVLLDERRIEFFQKHPVAGIQATLYGTNDDVYERVTGKRLFGTVMKNLMNADKALLPIILTVTPNKYLGKDDEDLVRMAASTGIPFNVNSALMTPREETGRNDGFKDLSVEDYIRLFCLEAELKGSLPPPECTEDLPETGGEPGEAPKGVRCGAGRSGFNITWDGKMIPCNRLYHISAKPLEIGFKSAWEYLNSSCCNYLLPCECETCPYQPAAHTCAAKHVNAAPGHCDPAECKWCKAMVKAGFAKTR